MKQHFFVAFCQMLKIQKNWVYLYKGTKDHINLIVNCWKIFWRTLYFFLLPLQENQNSDVSHWNKDEVAINYHYDERFRQLLKISVFYQGRIVIFIYSIKLVSSTKNPTYYLDQQLVRMIPWQGCQTLRILLLNQKIIKIVS